MMLSLGVFVSFVVVILSLFILYSNTTRPADGNVGAERGEAGDEDGRDEALRHQESNIGLPRCQREERRDETLQVVSESQVLNIGLDLC
jgi:hypothetical protein